MIKLKCQVLAATVYQFLRDFRYKGGATACFLWLSFPRFNTTVTKFCFGTSLNLPFMHK